MVFLEYTSRYHHSTQVSQVGYCCKQYLADRLGVHPLTMKRPGTGHITTSKGLDLGFSKTPKPAPVLSFDFGD
jgi:hypothetical protein